MPTAGASSLNAEEKAVIPIGVNTGRKIPLQPSTYSIDFTFYQHEINRSPPPPPYR